METGLKNRVAVVTGASQGIGRATALALAAEGAHLALCSRNSQALEQVAVQIREKFEVQVHTEPVDVRNSAHVDNFIGNVGRLFDRVDVCVTNAGGPPAKEFLDTSDQDWDDAFHVNLRGVVTFARAVIPFMQQQRWGRIITISSITVRQPQPLLVLSNAVRAGVTGLVRSLSNDFAKDGILVNNVGPGYTATDRLKKLAERRSAASGESEQAIQQTWIDQIPVGRLGKAEEVADAIVWLASERASFISGQTILVDGGMYRGL